MFGGFSIEEEMICVYAGSFDPFSLGHLDIVERAANIFDKLIIAIGHNPAKKTMFDTSQRIEFIKVSCSHIKNIEVMTFGGMLIDFCHSQHATVIVRGLRAVTDFESELAMAHINRQLAPDIDTTFLVTRPENSFVSSSAVKEIWKMGGDPSSMVPPFVASYLKAVRHTGRWHQHKSTSTT